ncbi:MAG: hypothetical protein HS104_19315 [Polyangiaceae bacterium]|nr:hypothetical protein [Polyangiaceae bacterium]MBK8998452.1 hypothetical protein [Myxococcales bacterium]MCL4752507.1 hypothetical protein [Myxococcales bacterium]
MNLDVPSASTSGVTTRDIVGMVVVGVIILVMWLAFRNFQKLVEKDDDEPK